MNVFEFGLVRERKHLGIRIIVGSNKINSVTRIKRNLVKDNIC